MPLTVRIPDDLRDRIDALRGDVPRERWIRRALEGTLEREGTWEGKGASPDSTEGEGARAT